MITHSQPATQFMRANAPRNVLESVLAALATGRISEAVARFNDAFIFCDRALGLEFVDKARLGEFFRKSRELFPEIVLEVTSTYECGDHVIAEWQITGAQMVHYGYGGFQLGLPISVRGVSVVRTENGGVTHWSDYYDAAASRRTALAVPFTEFQEY